MSIQQQQVEVNIEAIIEYLSRVPGVTKVEVEPLLLHDELWGKKVFVTFAGCDEQVVMELY
jgi:hypothetical protein